MDNLEYRMYVFVPYNISEIQKGIQALHCVAEYGHKFSDSKEYDAWVTSHKTVILLNGGTTRNSTPYDEMGTMNQILTELKSHNVDVHSFYEEDLNHALTAVCFICDSRVFDKETYPDFVEGEDFENDTHAYIKRYKDWFRSIGGTRNRFLRELLSDKRLA
jgi:hypothetical protein